VQSTTPELHRIRFVAGALERSVLLVRECTGLDLDSARSVVERQGVVLDQLGLSEARRLLGVFHDAGCEAELEPSSLGPVTLAQTSARERALEAVLRERPDDLAAHLVYGDWLQAQGDPRGELVALQVELARAEGPARLALERKDREFRQLHAEQLFGALHPFADELVRRWSYGFIDAASVGVRDHDGATVPLRMLPCLLELPIAARMTSLSLPQPPLRRRDVDRVLCKSEVIACLRTLELRDYYSPSSPRKAPGLAPLWPHLRKLETLIVEGSLPPLRQLSVATLRHLVLRMRDVHSRLSEQLPDAPLSLETLTLEFTERAPDWSSVANLFGYKAPRARVHELALVFSNSLLNDNFAWSLARIMGLLEAKRLDLSRCRANPSTLQVLIEQRDRGELPADLRLPSLTAPA
jgi:uncharacterized protein (TIGR02996 family)